MKKVVGISFKISGKVYNFDPATFILDINDKVIVETEKGLQFGYVASNMVEVEDDKLVNELKPVVRIASKKDVSIHEKNVSDAKKALVKAQEFVKELNFSINVSISDLINKTKSLFKMFLLIIISINWYLCSIKEE